MFLKLMSNEDMPDDSHAKGCTIIANVIEAKYGVRRRPDQASGSRPEWETYVEVTYAYGQASRGNTMETFVLGGNAYLMNESGKTIQSFSQVHPESA